MFHFRIGVLCVIVFFGTFIYLFYISDINQNKIYYGNHFNNLERKAGKHIAA